MNTDYYDINSWNKKPDKFFDFYRNRDKSKYKVKYVTPLTIDTVILYALLRLKIADKPNGIFTFVQRGLPLDNIRLKTRKNSYLCPMSLVKYSKLSDYKIKKVLRHFCADVDATQTSYLLSINRNTINRLFKLFREAIYRSRIETLQTMLTKEVEFDEAYFGSKRIRGKVGTHKRGRGTWKRPVFGIFERDGEVYTELIPDSSRRSLQQVILKRVSPEAIVYSDGWRGYDGLVDVGYNKHFRINKSKHFSDGKGVHINGIESFWSFTKRRLSKFNGVKAHFDLHLKECEWRWKKSEEQMFKELVFLLKRE